MKRLLTCLILLISLAACQPAASGEEGDFTPAPTFTLAASLTPTATRVLTATAEPPDDPCAGDAEARAIYTIRAVMQQPDLELKVNSSGGSPYNHEFKVATLLDKVSFQEYTVICASGELVEVTAGKLPASGGGELSKEELEQAARDMLARAAPDLDLAPLKFSSDAKEPNHFYRWEGTKKLTDPPGGMTVFAQVGLNQYGELISYINLFPLLPEE